VTGDTTMIGRLGNVGQAAAGASRTAPRMLRPAPGVSQAAPGASPGARVVAGLGLAQLLFAATFRGPRPRFWQRMTITGLSLGSYALAAAPATRRARLRPLDVALGTGSAAVLYATFWAGDRFARRFVPTGEGDIAEIYALRELEPRLSIAARLATVIGPAEELFWRGFVQTALMERYGRWPGAAAATAAYGGVHVVTGNFTLFGAASVAGAHWSVLHALGVPLGALIASHVIWDTWIFLVQPTGVVRPTPE
jgi:CAAX protease family protein